MIARISSITLCAFVAGLLVVAVSSQARSLTLPQDASPLPSSVNDGLSPLRIAPAQSHPHGRTYSEWSTLWWRWAVEIPADVNPVLDTTGEQCAEGQEGHVWFLAGIFGAEEATRECTIPTGTAMFFPLINFATFSVPPENPTLEDLREAVACITQEVDLFLEVDGREVDRLNRFFAETEVFQVQLPENNIFGLEGDTVLGPNLGAGYYIFLRPLPPGEHTIHWEAEAIDCGFTQDITYHLILEPERRR